MNARVYVAAVVTLESENVFEILRSVRASVTHRTTSTARLVHTLVAGGTTKTNKADIVSYTAHDNYFRYGFLRPP